MERVEQERFVLTNVTGTSSMAMNVSDNQFLDDTNELAASSPSYSLFLTRLIVQKYLVPVVVLCGLLGNIFNIIVLVNPKMRTSTNIYLLSLAICDSMYLLFCLSLSFLHCSNKTLPEDALWYILYARVFSDLFGNTSVWLTVCFTLERFIAIRLPMRGKAWCTVRKAKFATLTTSIACAINTFPEFFETKVVKVTTNVTHYYHCSSTEFAESHSYQFGYYWWFVATFTFMPLILLSVFNSLLIKSVWQANKKRQFLSHTRVTGESQKQNKEQQRVTLMLISVVLIFLLCQTPQAVLLIYRSYVQAISVSYPADLIKIAGNVCNLLVQINASVNFILYSYFSSRFRRTFKQVICGCDSGLARTASSTLSVTFGGRRLGTYQTTLSPSPSCKSRKSETGSVGKKKQPKNVPGQY